MGMSCTLFRMGIRVWFDMVWYNMHNHAYLFCANILQTCLFFILYESHGALGLPRGGWSLDCGNGQLLSAAIGRLQWQRDDGSCTEWIRTLPASAAFLSAYVKPSKAPPSEEASRQVASCDAPSMWLFWLSQWGHRVHQYIATTCSFVFAMYRQFLRLRWQNRATVTSSQEAQKTLAVEIALLLLLEFEPEPSHYVHSHGGHLKWSTFD